MAVIDHVLLRFEQIVVGLGLGAATIATFVEVVLRYVFNSSLGWGGEFTNMTIIWAVMVGAAMGVRTGVHIGVDVLVQRLPGKLAKSIVLMSLLVSAAFTAWITVLGVELVLFSMQTRQVTMEMLFPRWPLYASVPTGMALMTYHLIQQFFIRLRMSSEEVLAGMLGEKEAGVE